MNWTWVEIALASKQGQNVQREFPRESCFWESISRTSTVSKFRAASGIGGKEQLVSPLRVCI